MGELKNRFFFNLRNKLKLSRNNYCPPFENKTDIICDRFEVLNCKYDIANLATKFSQSLYKIQLYHIDLLDRFVSPYINKFKCLNIFDAGCDNWHYLPGLWTWARTYTNDANIDGMELDPWRMYLNGHTKKSFANGVCDGYESVNYIGGDCTTYTKKANFVFCSLPLIVESEARQWQIPKKYFNPLAQLKHLWAILENGGALVVVNIDIEEGQSQKELFKKAHITPSVLCEPFISSLCEYPTVRVVSVAIKN